MERVYHLGGVTAASILSVASADNLMIWAWLLIAVEATVYMLLPYRSSQRRIKSAPVPSRARPVPPRPAARSPWR